MKYLGVPQSGSQDAVTASRNRFGQYYRNRAIPVNPATAKQASVRANFSNMSATYRTFTDAQRAAWEACAAENPIVNSLGQTVVLTGAQMFVRSALGLIAAGLAPIITPGVPTVFATTAITPTGAAGTPALSIAFTVPAAGKNIAVYASQQRSAGVSFEDDFRLIGSRSSTDTSPWNVLTLYTAIWGTLIAGKKIFWLCKAVNECGVLSSGYRTSMVVAA